MRYINLPPPRKAESCQSQMLPEVGEIQKQKDGLEICQLG